MKKINGMHYKYSKVNQAWFLLWFDHILGIYTDKAEMLKVYAELLN